MRKTTVLFITLLLMFGFIPLSVMAAGVPGVSYQTHVQNQGWQGFVSNGVMSGTSGQALRLEGIKIKLDAQGNDLGISYQTHIQNIGWEEGTERGWISNGEISGTSGQGLRLEGIQIKLTGSDADQFDVYYQVHAQNHGWLDWAKNGESAGSQGFSYRLEGIKIVVVPKGAAAPGNTNRPFIQASNPFEEQVIALVNQERAARNLGIVTSDPSLTLAAQIRAQEIIGTFSHTRPDQRSFSTVLSDAGISYRYAGENIAAGQASAEAVVSGWMNSEGHRANILNPEFTKLGVGYTYADSGYGHYWSQLFISN
ncbi:CAP domain-containing protein [Acetobacterium bakii]|uniref:CAP domain-containing protein n=1 Tax=Acetobacterium bakii TaxID=52689 RepID=UPI000680CE4E|nr:CAP domain-containing protein [Acetobacterium bakii]